MHGSSGRLATLFGMPAFIEGNIALQRRMLDAVDAFVVLTKQAARIVALNGVPPGKLFVNPLGVSHSKLAQKPIRPTSLPITVGYLGRFDEIKGVFDLANAIALLPKKTPIRFEFRGPIQSDDEKKIVAKIKDIVRNDSRVAVDDAVLHDDVPELLRRWDVACFPPRCLEGGPTAALEAYSVGTPVIGTRIGGLAEFVMDGVNGALVEPTDTAALSKLLQRIADDPAGTIDMWRTNISPPRTMDEIASDYLAIYKSILASVMRQELEAC
jgi:glycosyltransferase involved in cell wall biosynthesis